MSVIRARVGDVLALQRRPAAISFDGVYGEIGIRSFGRGVFHKEPISGAALGSKRVFWIEPGDLLLSNVFAWEGAIAVAGFNELGKIGSHRFMTYTAVDDRIDTTWASWFFRSDPGLELIRRASPGSAGRNRTLAIDRFEALEIPLPPIDEQCRIAQQLNRIATASEQIVSYVSQSARLAAALPLAIHAEHESSGKWPATRLGDVLELIRIPIEIDPRVEYTTLGVKNVRQRRIPLSQSARRPDRQTAVSVGRVGLLVVSNIQAWEVWLTTEQSDERTVRRVDSCSFGPVAAKGDRTFSGFLPANPSPRLGVAIRRVTGRRFETGLWRLTASTGSSCRYLPRKSKFLSQRKSALPATGSASSSAGQSRWPNAFRLSCLLV